MLWLILLNGHQIAGGPNSSELDGGVRRVHKLRLRVVLLLHLVLDEALFPSFRRLVYASFISETLRRIGLIVLIVILIKIVLAIQVH